MIDNQENRNQEVTEQDQKCTQELSVYNRTKIKSTRNSRQMMSTGGVFVILYFLVGGDWKAGECNVVVIEIDDDCSLRGDEGP